MRKAAKSREELIEDLTRVFRQHGYYGTTLSKLTQATGLEKASLYHYFPKGKTQMAEQVFAFVLQKLQETVLQVLESKESAEVKLKNFLDALDIFYNKGTTVCFLTIFSVGEQSTHMESELGKALAHWEALLADVMKDLGLQEPRKQAAYSLSVIQGGLILSHLKSDQRIFQNNLEILRKVWGG